MKYNKSIIYFKHIFSMCFKNKFRFFLSVLGLFVGLFIFTTGNILIDTYYNEQLKDSSQMEEEIIALNYYSDESIKATDIYKETIPTISTVSNSYRNVIFDEEYTNGSHCSVSAEILGVSSIYNILPINDTLGEKLFVTPKLIKGRLLTEMDNIDNNNVIVIDEFTEIILFPDGDSLGNYINLNVENQGFSNVSTQSESEEDVDTDLKCKVVGVVENSYIMQEEEMKYNKFLSDKEDSIILNTMVYCPSEFVTKNLEILDNRFLAYKTNSTQQLNQIESNFDLYKKVNYDKIESYQIITKDLVDESVYSDLNSTSILLMSVLIILLLVSGINAMSTMFFTVKERINEIGIKKALGASKVDILTQFICEGIIIALITSVITLFLSLIVCMVIQYYLNNYMFTLFTVNLTVENILLPILIAAVYGFVFSIIPSYYGAKIKVTDSLRFE